MASRPLIFNIQRFSTHDGPGIRTTVFFKGCPLRCAWCHNPESQSFAPQLMVDEDRCLSCGMCLAACPQGAIARDADGCVRTDRTHCVACGSCVDFCPEDVRELAGSPAPLAAELAERLLADRMFFERSGGGVTLSGGECLVQDIDYLEGLCRILHDEGVHIAIDTCGLASREHIERLLPYTDLWLYDLKVLDDEVHRRVTGVSNEPILDNLAFLARSGAVVEIRVPVVHPVNDSEEAMRALAVCVTERVGAPRVSLLPYHTAGTGKYRRLGIEPGQEAFCAPSAEHMDRLVHMLVEQGLTDVGLGG